jgi:hypothetical protein
MRLEDCVLDADIIISAPMVRTEPEEEWVRASKSGAIPSVLFDFYCRAGFLSFGSAPAFLQYKDHILFSYFSLLLRSVMESLVDADIQLGLFSEAQRLTYDVSKKIRGESWDETAGTRGRRHFRDLLIAEHSALDSLADLTAARGVRDKENDYAEQSASTRGMD